MNRMRHTVSRNSGVFVPRPRGDEPAVEVRAGAWFLGPFPLQAAATASQRCLVSRSG